jgi:hypothetical protein
MSESRTSIFQSERNALVEEKKLLHNFCPLVL